MSKKGGMQAFADTEITFDPIDWKSICRYIFIISESVVCFNSTKQRFVTGLTMEAKYIALSLASQQAIWTCYLISSIKYTLQIWQFLSSLVIIKPHYNRLEEYLIFQRSSILT